MMITTCDKCGGMRGDPNEMFGGVACSCADAELYEFVNCEGAVVRFPGSATLGELVKAGVKRVEIQPKNDPMPTDPKWYVNTP